MRARLTPFCTLALLTSAAVNAQIPRHPRPAPEAKPDPATELPVTRVALYKNGVGFFEHSGRVLGNQSITIDFTSAQLNDVLQSLTAIDLGGGRISGAGYNSTTPLEQQLKTLPLALGPDPDSTAFYNAIRGARVEVHSGAASITGRLLSIETRTEAQKDGEPTLQKQFLTVVSDAGAVRTLELTPSTEVRLLDTALHTDVTRYLELLSNNRNQGLRHLTLLDRAPDRGTGARDLRVSYISEVPVWKSTYRILFTDGASSAAASNQTATLQGWSVVDNTTGSDWQNVHLSLIAGAPQSFIQPLSTPYYTRRPEIPLPAEAQLAPQTHESGDMTGSGHGGLQGTVNDSSGATIPNARITAANNNTGAQVTSTTGSDGSFSIPLPQAGQYTVEVSSPGFQTRRQGVRVDGEQMATLNLQLTVGSASSTVEVSDFAAAVRPLMAGRSVGASMGNGNGTGLGAGSGGAIGGGVQRIGGGMPSLAYQQFAQASINPNTSTAAFDDFFEYSLTDPITIRKNESALVPILQTKLPVERVTLWSAQQPVALRALWITNSSALTLDRGSFSIVENGNFGGEGLLDPIHPNERRLLSYAADQAVRVSTDYSHSTSRIQHLKISKGVLTETSSDVAEVEYLVRNAAPEPRLVLIEQPIRQGWTLDSDPKPAETTATAYRFRVATKAGETVRLHIGERHTNLQYIRLVDRTEDQLILLLRNAKASPGTLAALQPVFDAHHAVTALDDGIRANEAEVASITQDQNRLRENLKSLKGTTEEKALATRYTGELNAQEDRLDALHKQLAQLHTERNAADGDFQNKLEAVNLDESL